MDAFENVLSPSDLNAFQVDARAELVIIGNLRNFDCNIDRAARVVKGYQAVGMFSPVLELPLHFNKLVLFQPYVLALNGAVVKHVLASLFWLTHAGRLGELATGHLLSQGAEDKLRGAVVSHLDLCLLNHFYFQN